MPTCQLLGNDCKIVGNDTPAQPAFHARLAFVAAAIQAPRAFEAADATLDPSAEAQGGFEPGLGFVGLTLRVFDAAFGQSGFLDARLMGSLFVVGRRHPAITRRDVGRMTKVFERMLQTGLEVLLVGRIAFEQTILRDDPTIHFAEPDLASELGLVRRGLAPPNDGGMRFKQADDFSSAGTFSCLKTRRTVWSITRVTNSV